MIGPKGNELEMTVLGRYMPDAVVVLSTGGEGEIPLLDGKAMIDNKATAYVCESFVCRRPVTTVEELIDQILT